MGISDAIQNAVVGRWIVGRTLDDAVKAVKKLNKRGITALINYIDFNITDREDLLLNVRRGKALVEAIAKEKLDAEITVRASQLGMQRDVVLMQWYLDALLDVTKRYGVYVWLDMEQEQYVDTVIGAYATRMKRGNFGICLQSYLKRSYGDMRKLVKLGAAIRLVKGGYKYVPGKSFETRAEVTNEYIRMMTYLFENSKSRFVIASHDPTVINMAMAYQSRYKRKMMFGMLYGMRNAYAAELANAGYNVEMYLPYGKNCMEYMKVRMSVSRNLRLFLSSFFYDQKL